MITITSLVLFFIEDISCVIKVSHKKPIKIKIQAKPSLLVKPFPFFLLKKYHGKKIRLGWPLTALFTLKAVKYAKVSRVKVRQCRLLPVAQFRKSTGAHTIGIDLFQRTAQCRIVTRRLDPRMR